MVTTLYREIVSIMADDYNLWNVSSLHERVGPQYTYQQVHNSVHYLMRKGAAVKVARGCYMLVKDVNEGHIANIKNQIVWALDQLPATERASILREMFKRYVRDHTGRIDMRKMVAKRTM